MLKDQAPKTAAKAQKALKKTIPSPKLNKLVNPKRNTHFMAKELFEVVQAAITVKFFEAKHGEKGEREKQMGNMLRKNGVQGSNAVLRTRMLELLVWHKVCIYTF
jgi:hypothetical protein